MSDILLWLDVETTGLDSARDSVLEIGVFPTRLDGTVLHTPVVITIRPRLWGFKRHWMSSKPFDMHTANGLLDEVNSPLVVDPQTARSMLRPLIQKCCDKGRVLLAGSSVHFDRQFLNTQYPGLLDGINYRLLDVSVLDEVAKSERPDVWQHRPERTTNHRVLNCLRDSMSLYQYYLDNLIARKVV